MKNSALEKARSYAFLLLKFRLRSENEIYQRLKRKFDEPVVKETVAFLKSKGFIDDKVFAKVWLESRLKRKIGLNRITKELELKGIDKEIIDNLLEYAKQDYCENEIIAAIAKERLNKLRDLEPVTAKRRVYGYLARRGFSPQTIIDVLNQLCNHTF